MRDIPWPHDILPGVGNIWIAHRAGRAFFSVSPAGLMAIDPAGLTLFLLSSIVLEKREDINEHNLGRCAGAIIAAIDQR